MRLLALSALLLLAAIGCASAVPPQAASASLGTVTIRMTGDWPGLDPNPAPGAGACNIPCSTVVYPLYDRLVATGPDPKNAGQIAIIPYLATSWTATPTQVTFNLRKDATCADGSPVTASVVKRSFERILGGGRNVATYGGGPFSMEADDAQGTFTLNLQTPFNDAIYAFTTAVVVCSSGLDHEDQLANQAFGSGPYTIAEAVHGDHMTLKRRDDWKWGPGGVVASDLPDTLVIRVVPNDTTAANLLITGGLDIAQINGPDVTRLLADNSLISKSSTSFYNNPLLFNEDPSRPTGDPRVREALASAIDRNAFNTAAYQGHGTLSSSYLQPNADCFDPSTADLLPTDPSPDRARQLLIADGWSPGADGKLQKNGQPLVVQIMGVPAIHGSGPEYIAAQWEQAGVTVDTSGITDFNTWSQRRFQSNFDATLITWPHDLPDPSTSIPTYVGPLPPTGPNYGKVVNPVAEAALAAAKQAVGGERCAQWSMVQRAMLQEFDILPLSAPQTFFFSRGLDFVPASVNGFEVYFIRRAK
jgi:peptide/nickel transport system substrate-binding protein